MGAFSLLISLFAVDFLAVVSPGPAFVVVTQMSARHGTRVGLAVMLGLVTSCWVWCAIVLSGLTILFQVLPWLYSAMKVAGGLYLAWLGIGLLHDGPQKPSTGADGCVAAAQRVPNGYVKGLWVGLTNPKAMVYFGSVFTLFLKPGSPLWLDTGAVAIVTFDCFVWYGLVGVLFSRAAVRRRYEKLQHWIERAAGAVMLAFGARLVLVKD